MSTNSHASAVPMTDTRNTTAPRQAQLRVAPITGCRAMNYDTQMTSRGGHTGCHNLRPDAKHCTYRARRTDPTPTGPFPQRSGSAWPGIHFRTPEKPTSRGLPALHHRPGDSSWDQFWAQKVFTPGCHSRCHGCPARWSNPRAGSGSQTPWRRISRRPVAVIIPIRQRPPPNDLNSVPISASRSLSGGAANSRM